MDLNNIDPATPLGQMLNIIRCEWGVAVFSEADTARCWAQATNRTMIYGGTEGTMLIQTCPKHFAMINEATDAHQFDELGG